MLFDLLQHVDAAKARHLEIYGDEINRHLFEHFNRLGATVRSMNIVVGVENHL